MQVPESTVDFLKQLLMEVPEIQPIYDSHMQEHEELLPHVFMGDLTRYIVQEVCSGAVGPSRPATRALAFLERGMTSGDDDVLDLIHTSFLENLLEEDGVASPLKEVLGPRLAKGLQVYGKWEK